MQRSKKTQGDVALMKEIFPVTKAIAYGNGCYRFIRTAKKEMQAGRPERGKIMKFSKDSLIRLMFIMQCTDVDFGSMLTLTYPKSYPLNGRIVKADINLVAQRIRREKWSYLWFLEFQARGAPHIHFMLTPDVVTPRMRVGYGLFWTERIATSNWFLGVCPPEKYIAEVMKMARFNCHEQTMQVLYHQDGAKRYATKYAAKEAQKEVPKKYKEVGRFWGASRDVTPEGLEFDVTEKEVEEWLVDNNHPATAYEMVPRYIWGLGTHERDNPAQVLQKSGQKLM